MAVKNEAPWPVRENLRLCHSGAAEFQLPEVSII